MLAGFRIHTVLWEHLTDEPHAGRNESLIIKAKEGIEYPAVSGDRSNSRLHLDGNYAYCPPLHGVSMILALIIIGLLAVSLAGAVVLGYMAKKIIKKNEQEVTEEERKKYGNQ